MNFETKNKQSIGKKIGYVFMYFVFTTILYFILTFLNKIPQSWNYIHILNLTLFIVLLGTFLKILLK